MEGKFFKVKELKNIIKKGNLQSSPVNDVKYAPYDFRFLKNESGADYALVLDPRAFGLSRSYYGFVPTSPPAGYANMSVYLVNLSDNSIVGEYGTIIQEETYGEWDTPPEYKGLVAATKNVLSKVLNDAYGFFFQK